MTPLMQQPGSAEKRLALLGSFCLFLSAIEYIIPKPLPFMRIGLANLPLLLALGLCKPKDYFLLALLKVLGQGIIGGTFFSYIFLFSLTGTFSSAAVMFFLYKIINKKHLGFIGLGCAGAMTSNIVQLLLARYFIFGDALRYLLPPFLASGFITGILLGIVCEYFCRYSQWYKRCPVPLPENIVNEIDIAKPVKMTFRLRRDNKWNDFFGAQELFLSGFIMALIFLFAGSLESRIVLFFFFFFLLWLSGKKTNLFIILLVMFVIIFFNLLVPYGKVLAVIGPLQITQGSLLSGINKAVTLEALVMLSRACTNKNLRLPGSIGLLLGGSFGMLELLRQKKHLIRRGHIIKGIDRIITEIEREDCFKANPPQKKQSLKALSLLGLMILTTFVLAFLVPLCILTLCLQ